MKLNGRIFTPNALAALVLLLWGCAPATIEQQVIGQWKGQLELGKQSEQNSFAQMAAQAFEPTINFKEDKTFAMTVAVLPVEGTWSVNGHKVTLIVTKISGQSKADFKKEAKREMAGNPFMSSPDLDKADKPIVLDVAPNAKTLQTGDIAQSLAVMGPLAPSGTVVFKRLGASD